jgi:hypothetical protein
VEVEAIENRRYVIHSRSCCGLHVPGAGTSTGTIIVRFPKGIHRHRIKFVDDNQDSTSRTLLSKRSGQELVGLVLEV